MVVAERPDSLPAWIGLGELYLRQARWDDVERTARHMEADGRAPVEAAVFRARTHLALRDFAAAQALLRQTTAANPAALRPRVVLSHALLQEGRDLDAAEKALRDVLALDASNAELRNNLAVLLRNRERAAADWVFGGVGPDPPTTLEALAVPLVVEANPTAAAVWEGAA